MTTSLLQSILTAVSRAGLACFALTVALATQSPAQAQPGYRAHHNARFGVGAGVPRSWKAGREPDNGDGLAFKSPDETAVITVSGMLNISDTVAEAMADEERARDGEIITYRSKGPRQAAISGTRGNVIFYRKTIMSCGDQVLNHLSIEYPTAQKKIYDGLVAHVSASLHGGPGEQISRCK